MNAEPTHKSSKAGEDAARFLFLLRALIGYAAFVSWAEMIVRAIRGEAAKENWKTSASSGLLLGFWALTSASKASELAALRGAADDLRSLVNDSTAKAELREKRLIERDEAASSQQRIMLSLTKWLVVLAVLTLATALAAIGVAVAD